MAVGRGGETEPKHASASVVTAVSCPGESSGLHGSRGCCESCQGKRERLGIVPVHYMLLSSLRPLHVSSQPLWEGRDQWLLSQRLR